MLSISTIRTGTQLVLKDEPYEVVIAAHHKMGRGGAVLKTKLRNLKTGSVINHTFQGKDSVAEADLDRAQVQYLYCEGDQFNFMDEATYEQFSLSREQLGPKADFLIDGTSVDILKFNDEPIGVDLPIKMTFAVTDAPPGIKGDTAQGGTKTATIETGKKIAVPLFINEGDKIVVDTRDGQYVERG
jgi:elongation factor P